LYVLKMGCDETYRSPWRRVRRLVGGKDVPAPSLRKRGADDAIVVMLLCLMLAREEFVSGR